MKEIKIICLTIAVIAFGYFVRDYLVQDMRLEQSRSDLHTMELMRQMPVPLRPSLEIDPGEGPFYRPLRERAEKDRAEKL